jgi:serine/threonine protein kinase
MPQSIVAPLRRWDPERIGPYAIIGRLGAGAMGQVFLARSTAGRLVAVKTIRIEFAEEAGFRTRFAREVAAARRVSGVFTAAVIEADPDADLPWVATAYVPAPSLSTLVKKAGPLPVPAVRWLAAGCAEALASIHGAGLLHRDVKPSNVLVAPDGPRVIDFGLARASERVQLTATHGAAGTPAYMAPEQARDATQASPASDVFSLGATLVYAATGHPPYHGETVMDILVRLATEPPDLDGLPGELTDLVSACLERVPRGRPTDGAILGRLGSFELPASAGHVYLPDSATAVIAEYLVVAEYQHHPRMTEEIAPRMTEEGVPRADEAPPVGGATDDSAASVVTDVTDGSHTPLPGFESPEALPQARPAEAGPPTPVPAGVPAADEPGPEPARQRRGVSLAAAWVTERALLPLWARLLIAVLLVGSGAAIGLAAHGSSPRAAPDRAADSSRATSTTGATRVTGASDAALGPVASPPPSCQPGAAGTGPALCVSQPFGDGNTVFVLHGTGFQPFSQVTVTLTGVGPSSDHPVTDSRGAFSYALDQGHLFFRGPIPPGRYQVTASASGGDSTTVTFRVDRVTPGTQSAG